MTNILDMISKNPIHISTNTIILIVIAIVAFYVFIKVVGTLVKIIAFVAICWFILMSVQSTNMANIPIIKQAYISMEKIIPSKDLWSKATDYMNDITKEIQKKSK